MLEVCWRRLARAAGLDCTKGAIEAWWKIMDKDLKGRKLSDTERRELGYSLLDHKAVAYDEAAGPIRDSPHAMDIITRRRTSIREKANEEAHAIGDPNILLDLLQKGMLPTVTRKERMALPILIAYASSPLPVV